MKFLTIVVVLFLFSCGSLVKPKHVDSDPSLTQALRLKHDLYLTLSKSHQDADGFILSQDCDSLLWSSLYGVGGGEVQIHAAQDSNGAWHRRSLNLPECYSDGSASTISRDMFIGLMWFAWEKKDLTTMNDLFHYGRNHNWVMGDGDISRTYFVPGLQATLSEIIKKLGGTNREEYRSIPQVYSKNTDYQAHLDMLHILLRADLTGSIDEATLNIVKYNHKRSLGNPFYSYVYHRFVDGDQTETYQILLNPTYPFPEGHLPTSAEYCTEWFTQRDAGQNWEPCTANGVTEHPGGDFIFVSYLLLSRG